MGTCTCDGPATGSSAYNPSMSSLFVGTGPSNCKRDPKAGARDGAEGRTVLRGGDLTVLVRKVELRGARVALSARSTARKPNGSESEALEGVPRSYSYRAVVAAPTNESVRRWSMLVVDGGRGELGGSEDEERE